MWGRWRSSHWRNMVSGARIPAICLELFCRSPKVNLRIFYDWSMKVVCAFGIKIWVGWVALTRKRMKIKIIKWVSERADLILMDKGTIFHFLKKKKYIYIYIYIDVYTRITKRSVKIHPCTEMKNNWYKLHKNITSSDIHFVLISGDVVPLHFFFFFFLRVRFGLYPYPTRLSSTHKKSGITRNIWIG